MANQVSVHVRRNNILDLLNTPMTIAELAAQCDASYHTVRRDVLWLLDHGDITDTGDIRGGGAIYVAGNQRPMPEFRSSRTDFVRMDTLANSYIKSPFTSNGSRAVLTVARILTELLALASNAQVYNLKIDANELKRLEYATQSALASIEAVATVTKSMLSNRLLWDATSLPSMASDPSFSPKDFLAAYEMLLRNLAEQETNVTD